MGEQPARHAQQIRLIVDGSKGVGHQLLTASLAYLRRAVPIARMWANRVRGYSAASV